MHFAGGSTILHNRSRFTQMKPKGHELFHGHLKKVIGVVGGKFTHMLYKYISLLLIALGKPPWKKCLVCGHDVSGL
jgi:predicted lipase